MYILVKMIRARAELEHVDIMLGYARHVYTPNIFSREIKFSET